ncbi:hypothetical protein [Actinoallomurus sp. CA-142502]
MTGDRYWAEPYVQHSPQMPSGLDTLRAVVPGLEGFYATVSGNPMV